VTLNRARRVTTTVRQRIGERGPAAAIRSVRLTGSAVAAYVAALPAVDDRRPVTAALTALLIVQVTLVGTLAETWRRIVSVLLGVGVAILVSTFVGLTWWSLGALVAVSILLGQLLRLGAHLLEVPISAMLILAAGGAGAQASDRVAETLLGAAIGVLVNLLLPPRPRTGTAAAAVERYAQSIARLLSAVADSLAAAPATREQARTWLTELRVVTGDAVQVDRILIEAQQSRRLNPRAAGTWNPVPDLRSGLDALEHAAVALRSVFRSVADGAIASVGAEAEDVPDEEEPSAQGPDDDASRTVIAAALHDVARSVATFGALLRAGSEHTSYAAELSQTLAAVCETRGRLAELLAVDPRADLSRWQDRGALLAGMQRVLAELDVEELGRRRERQRQDVAATMRTSTQAAQRLRSTSRRLIGDDRGSAGALAGDAELNVSDRATTGRPSVSGTRAVKPPGPSGRNDGSPEHMTHSTTIDSARDVVAFLKDQHEQIKALFERVEQTSADEREQAFTDLRRLLAVHETAEEEVVHPRARRELPDGDAVVTARLDEEEAAKKALVELEKLDVDSDEFVSLLDQLRADVVAHAAAEESEEFAQLAEELDENQLRRMRSVVALAEKTAPTRPHPGVELAGQNYMVGPFAAMLDRAKDLITGKR
jgi:hemerythrin superfamily protein